MNANNEYQFLYCVRGKGRKWVAVAGVESAGCLASARDMFWFAGFANGDAHYTESVTKQKNFAGYAPDFRDASMSEREFRRAQFMDRVARFGLEYAREMHPEFANEIDG